jgi:hypothetical protein
MNKTHFRSQKKATEHIQLIIIISEMDEPVDFLKPWDQTGRDQSGST